MSNHRLASFMTASFMLSMLASHALAQNPTEDTGGGPARTFGSQGSMVLSNQSSLELRHSSDGVTTVSIAPAADFFVIKNLSVGGIIAFDYAKVGNHDGTRFQVGPRVGYNLSFTNMLGMWPILGFSYAHSSAGYTVTNDSNEKVSTSKSNDSVAVDLFVPLMMHPVTHFFLGFGPFLTADLSGSNRVTAYGVRLALGGWLGL